MNSRARIMQACAQEMSWFEPVEKSLQQYPADKQASWHSSADIGAADGSPGDGGVVFVLQSSLQLLQSLQLSHSPVQAAQASHGSWQVSLQSPPPSGLAAELAAESVAESAAESAAAAAAAADSDASPAASWASAAESAASSAAATAASVSPEAAASYAAVAAPAAERAASSAAVGVSPAFDVAAVGPNASKTSVPQPLRGVRKQEQDQKARARTIAEEKDTLV